MIEYKYAYLIGILFFLLIWVVLYIYKKNLRKEMIIMSLIIAPSGPISEFFYLKDYWNPNYLLNIFGFGLEDLIFAFLIGGIASVVYEELFVKKFKRAKPEKSYFILIIVIMGGFSMIFFNIFLKINSIYVSSITFLVIGIIILLKRKDLIKNAIYSGILVALIMFIFYLIYIIIFPDIIQNWWQIKNLSGLLIFGVPLEEIIWGFAWGFLAGPFYEFWKGIKEIPIKKDNLTKAIKALNKLGISK